MKASKRVENLLPSGILVVGLAAMALFGVGFSAFQTSNTMSPIENSIDVEVGSIIEGARPSSRSRARPDSTGNSARTALSMTAEPSMGRVPR